MNAILNSKARRSQLIAALVALIEKLPGILPKATFAVAGKRVTTAQVVEEAQLLRMAPGSPNSRNAISKCGTTSS